MMLNIERQALIAEMARQKQLVRISDLVEQFKVSDMTVRRDLDTLQKRGILKKVYGGAVLASQGVEVNRDVHMDVRVVTHTDRKREIAHIAVQMIEQDDVIILDAGTTTLELAKILPQTKDLVVVTNSIPIAQELNGRPSSLLIAGGMIRPSTQSTVGSKTKEFFVDLRANRLFLGAASVSVELGLLNSNLYESDVKQMMIASAEQVIVLADSSKFEAASFHRFAGWEAVNVLVSDHQLPEEIQAALKNRGVQVLTGTDLD